MPTAFKEWAAICRALAAGRQDVILRKGGIVEPGGEFRVDHRRFLLLPTYLHQSAEQLIPEARDLLAGLAADRSAGESLVLTHEAEVLRATRVASLEALAPFRSRHVWADAVVGGPPCGTLLTRILLRITPTAARHHAICCTG